MRAVRHKTKWRKFPTHQSILTFRIYKFSANIIIEHKSNELMVTHNTQILVEKLNHFGHGIYKQL